MPGNKYASIQHPRMYRALRRRGFSKEAAARISNARTPGHRVKTDDYPDQTQFAGYTMEDWDDTKPDSFYHDTRRSKASGTALIAIPPTGPHALFNQPGVGVRSRRRRRLKEFNWGAQVGGVISGNLVRGEGGRFSSGGGPSARQTASAASRERSQARRAARQARADERAAAHEAELAQEEATRAEEDEYIAAGATGRERQRRRAEIAAKRRARTAQRRERRRQEAAAERETRRQEDEQDAAAQEQQPKGGGGGGGKAKPTDEQKRAEQEKKKAENRKATAPKAGLRAEEADALAAVAEGGQVSEAQIDNLAELGLIAATGDNQFEATDAGRRALAAMERGDVRGALAAIQDGKAKLARDEARDTAKRAREDERRKRDEERKRRQPDPSRGRGQLPPERLPVSTMPTQIDPAAERERNRALAQRITRNLEERRRRRGNRGVGGITNVERQNAESSRRKEASAQEHQSQNNKNTRQQTSNPADCHRNQILFSGVVHSVSIPPSFTVFKDASGADRWAAITTTAYEDRDGEWISRKAIRQVVAAGDAGQPRGPLRFWHVPGLDLGDCDYQAALGDGRLLLESGTFRSKAAARIGAEAARRSYQMSPGFVHTRHEPRGGVFNQIALFERSFVPPGRASNLYTRLLTKETRMLTEEKKKEFEALAGDAEGRALLTQLLTQAETTTKAADAAGAVYKDAPEWAQDMARRLGALEETVKAPMPAEEMVEAGATEMADGAAELAEETVDEGASDLLDDEGFADLIVTKLMAAIGPLLELEKKMAQWAGEIKSAIPTAMAQQVATKDDARTKEIADLRERLKALEGDQPRAVRSSLVGGVWGDLIGTPITKELAAQLSAQQPGGTPPPDLTPQEQDAYRLIFGNE